jgi:hypothetical protein
LGLFQKSYLYISRKFFCGVYAIARGLHHALFDLPPLYFEGAICILFDLHDFPLVFLFQLELPRTDKIYAAFPCLDTAWGVCSFETPADRPIVLHGIDVYQ